MAVGLASAVANGFLNAIGNATNYTAPTAAWIQLHTGDPGSAGTSNIAGNATRKQVSFGSASGGAISNDADISWTSGEVDTSEDYTHWSIHDASTNGNFVCSGTVTANAVTTADEFRIPTGDLDLTLTTAS